MHDDELMMKAGVNFYQALFVHRSIWLFANCFMTNEFEYVVETHLCNFHLYRSVQYRKQIQRILQKACLITRTPHTTGDDAVLILKEESDSDQAATQRVRCRTA